MKSNQKAGNNSNQVSIGNVIINLSETQVREIAKKELELALNEAKLVAEDTARERIKEFSDIFIPKLVKAEMLSSFADPSIQFSYRNAEKTAICTDRELDYDILSELLIHKVKRKDDYTKSAAIEKAISEVNNLSEEALMMLTLIFSIEEYIPKSGQINKGLNALDELYGKIIGEFDLPITYKWMDNLDVTNCARISSISKYMNITKFFIDRFDGYVVKGIKKDSDDYKKSIDILNENNLPLNVLIENELCNDYVRLAVTNRKIDEKLTIDLDKQFINIILKDNQKMALNSIITLYEEIDDIVQTSFVDLLKQNKNINKIMLWWDNYLYDRHSATITPVGKVLAHTNAKRIDSSLPDLD